jgi:D-amino-acid dehydrogenase
MTHSPDVLVVGGGAIGMSAALELARDGARVTVLERGVGPGAGCSAGSAGLINVSHAAPLATPDSLRVGLRSIARCEGPFVLRPRVRLMPWIARFVRAALSPRRKAAAQDLLGKLALAGRDIHEELVARGLPTGYRRRGVLYACERAASLERVWQQTRRANGDRLQAQLLGPEDVSELAPELEPGLAGAVHCPDEGHLDSLRYVQVVADAARAAGVTVRTGAEALYGRLAHHRIDSLQTPSGQVRAGEFVLAAGAWSATLARTLGLHLPLEGGKGYHVDVAPSGPGPTLPVYLHEGRVVITPLDGRLRLAGMLELGTSGDSLNARRADAVVRAVRPRFRCLEENLRVLHTWQGLRPCAPDGLPFLGRPAGYENLIVATGHAHLGIVLAPITARIVSRLAARKETGYDLTLASPDRYQGGILAG